MVPNLYHGSFLDAWKKHESFDQGGVLLTGLCRQMEIVGELSALGISSRCTRAFVLTTLFDVVAAGACGSPTHTVLRTERCTPATLVAVTCSPAIHI